MYYRLVEHNKYHPSAYLEAKDVSACDQALCEGKAYDGDFIADAFNPDDFYFIDYIKSFCVSVYSHKFADAMRELNVNCIKFKKTTLWWGGENLTNIIGDEVLGFYTASLKILDVIDTNVKPIKYWPKLKKFKHEDFFITRKMPDDCQIGVDLKKPNIIICRSEFKKLCEDSGLKVSFRELPCEFGS
ncbi:hypothetical protein [Labrys neptuniae]